MLYNFIFVSGDNRPFAKVIDANNIEDAIMTYIADETVEHPRIYLSLVPYDHHYHPNPDPDATRLNELIKNKARNVTLVEPRYESFLRDNLDDLIEHFKNVYEDKIRGSIKIEDVIIIQSIPVSKSAVKY